MTLADLSAAVGLSISAVQARLKRLESRGVVTGYRALVDAEAVGRPLAAFIEITPLDPAQPDNAPELLEHLDAIEACHSIAGDASYMLFARVASPRALEEAAAVPASVHIHTEKAMAEVTMTPGHAGPMAATIVVMTGDFGPLDAKEIALVLSNPSAGIEQIKRQARKSDDGIWRVDDLTLPVPGQWTVRVDILVSDFERFRIEDRIDIRR